MMVLWCDPLAIALTQRRHEDKGGNNMKLTDLDVDLVQSALGEVRTAWINAAREENRRHTEVELVTMSILAAVQRVLLKATSEQKPGTFGKK